ncbi:type VI secretion system baseplate subunit TssK [Massilia sp. W12]|uniref:type VI secretion system baseplate subunit TssK n=1 Tax=Massilia sp. W12 TaxID=3126507 RepID=UPI0030D1EFF7
MSHSLSLLPEAIQWSEGMLLSPQHFQQNDIYWHQHLRHRIRSLQPYSHGVLQLECALIKDVVSISLLECILPDGLLVQFPGKFPRLPEGNLEIDVGADCKPGGAPLKVWLRVNERGPAAALQSSRERRFNSVLDADTADENTGEGWQQLARLQIELQLYVGSRSPSPNGAIALLEVVRDLNEKLIMTPYHPPMLHLNASRFQGERSLQRRLLALHDLLWDKAQKLAGQTEANAQEAELGQEIRQHLNAARHIASCLPQFSVQLHEQCHPQLAYQALTHVVGAVACLGGNPLPLLMKPFAHDDCMPQFQAAFDYIEAKLTQVETNYENMHFTRADHHCLDQLHACYERMLPADLHDGLLLELKPSENQNREQMQAWLEDARIASADVMPQLLRARLPGAQVRALTSQEIERLKMRPQAALFLIRNRPLHLSDERSQLAFHAGKELQVMGRKNNNQPQAIILHRRIGGKQ